MGGKKPIGANVGRGAHWVHTHPRVPAEHSQHQHQHQHQEAKYKAASVGVLNNDYSLFNNISPLTDVQQLKQQHQSGDSKEWSLEWLQNSLKQPALLSQQQQQQQQAVPLMPSLAGMQGMQDHIGEVEDRMNKLASKVEQLSHMDYYVDGKAGGGEGTTLSGFAGFAPPNRMERSTSLSSSPHSPPSSPSSSSSVALAGVRKATSAVAAASHSQQPIMSSGKASRTRTKDMPQMNERMSTIEGRQKTLQSQVAQIASAVGLNGQDWNMRRDKLRRLLSEVDDQFGGSSSSSSSGGGGGGEPLEPPFIIPQLNPEGTEGDASVEMVVGAEGVNGGVIPTAGVMDPAVAYSLMIMTQRLNFMTENFSNSMTMVWDRLEHLQAGFDSLSMTIDQQQQYHHHHHHQQQHAFYIHREQHQYQQQHQRQHQQPMQKQKHKNKHKRRDEAAKGGGEGQVQVQGEEGGGDESSGAC